MRPTSPAARRDAGLIRKLVPPSLLIGLAGAAALSSGATGANPPSATPPPPPRFTDVSAATGLAFQHDHGATGKLYFAEIMGAGGALVDVDGDGDLDALLLQGGGLEPATGQAWGPGGQDRLYRNLLVESGKLAFEDITGKAGLPKGGYGMAVGAGDFDGDGVVDLYLANFGPNHLLRGRGDGTFEDVTAQAGADDPRWSIAVSPVDFDRDGHLDLAIGNYTDFRVASHKSCYNRAGVEDYCGPTAYGAEANRLLRNKGDGTFEDVSHTSGFGRQTGATLGLVAADFDGDGWPDLYEANDLMPNRLWLNQGDGTFVDDALLAGAALAGNGQPEASMGVEAADLDGDLDLDLFLTHLVDQTNTLYLNDGAALFRDGTDASGLGTPSWRFTGFGTRSLDFDRDGVLDLLVVNGAVTIDQELAAAGDPLPFHQRNQLFRGLGGGRFADVTDEAGAAFALSEASRGAALGDVDNDGDLDALITNCAGPARLLLDDSKAGGAWLGLRLTDAAGRRDLLGATALVRVAGTEPRLRRAANDGSYASVSDPRILVGLGAAEAPATVEVRWPDGERERWEGLALDRYHTLKRGQGQSGRARSPDHRTQGTSAPDSAPGGPR